MDIYVLYLNYIQCSNARKEWLYIELSKWVVVFCIEDKGIDNLVLSLTFRFKGCISGVKYSSFRGPLKEAPLKNTSGTTQDCVNPCSRGDQCMNGGVCRDSIEEGCDCKGTGYEGPNCTEGGYQTLCAPRNKCPSDVFLLNSHSKRTRAFVVFFRAGILWIKNKSNHPFFQFLLEKPYTKKQRNRVENQRSTTIKPPVSILKIETHIRFKNQQI